MGCTNPRALLGPLYIPPVIFHGIIGKEEVTYKGNFMAPNTVSSRGDTILLEFFSDNFSRGTMFQGDRLWIHLIANDTDSSYDNGDISLHFSRYTQAGHNITYDVFLSDTIRPFTAPIGLRTGYLPGNIWIHDLYARPMATQPSAELITIEKGEISGDRPYF